GQARHACARVTAQHPDVSNLLSPHTVRRPVPPIGSYTEVSVGHIALSRLDATPRLHSVPSPCPTAHLSHLWRPSTGGSGTNLSIQRETFGSDRRVLALSMVPLLSCSKSLGGTDFGRCW